MKKYASLAIVGMICLLSACQKDDEKIVDLTTQEASERISETAALLVDDVVSLVNTKGIDALSDLAELLDGSDVLNSRISQDEWTKHRLDVLFQYFVKGPARRVSRDANQMALTNIKGLYVWNDVLNDFEKEDSEIFIVQFPAANAIENNAELRISVLEFLEISISEDTDMNQLEMPSSIISELKVDDIKIASLNYQVDWSDEGLPNQAEINIFLQPFDLSLKFDDTFPSESSLLSSIFLDEKIICTIDMDVTFETSAKEVFTNVAGAVSYRDMKLAGNFAWELIGADADPNDYINLSLSSDAAAVGNVVFILESFEDGYQDYVPYVQYPDGSRESLEELIEPAIEEIETLFESI